MAVDTATVTGQRVMVRESTVLLHRRRPVGRASALRGGGGLQPDRPPGRRRARRRRAGRAARRPDRARVRLLDGRTAPGSGVGPFADVYLFCTLATFAVAATALWLVLEENT
jgi:hypothetical protein